MAVYKLKAGEKVRTTIAVKGSSTVIPAGSIVAISSGLIIAGAAASTAIAWCPKGAANGTTECEITVGNDFTLIGEASTAFAVANRGAEVDMNDTTQTINLGASSTDVFKVGVTADSGTDGATTGIEVRINKPIF